MQRYTFVYHKLLKSIRFVKNVECFFSSGAKKKVFLHDFHVERKAKMVDFAGFLMPLQYADLTISASHRHTRKHVSIFDVSHMLQTIVTGKDRVKYIESLVVSDIEGLDINQGTLTVFTADNGGIIDDLIVTKTFDSLYLVSNAGCSDKDLMHLQVGIVRKVKTEISANRSWDSIRMDSDLVTILMDSISKRLQQVIDSDGHYTKKKEEFIKNGADVALEVVTDKALLAIQGPGAAKVLQPLVECDLNVLKFMTTTSTRICGVDACRITRCGYTGEDGVEISVPASQSRLIMENLLASKMDDVKLAGLGSRDTLRLEAGLCLYGNDITDEFTPVEAALTWTIGKRRRLEGGFPGSDRILKQLKKGSVSKKRVGFISEGACPRASTNIMSSDGTIIGQITSGCPSPCLQKNVSMGYVDAAFAKTGTEVNFLIHKKQVKGRITKMPFVPTRYYVK